MTNIETNSAPNIFLSSLHIYIRLGFKMRVICDERLTKKENSAELLSAFNESEVI